MSRRRILVFNDYIHGTTAVYSSAFFNSTLGELERCALQVEVQAYSDLTAITVQMQVTGDGMNWNSKNSSPEISQGSVSQGNQVVLYGTDNAPVAALALGRVKITLSGTTPTAYVRVWAIGSPRIADVPTGLPGCCLWLRSDLGLTVNSSNAVSQWADQTGNGNHASQGTGSQQPIWTPNSVNGLPTLNFDGSNDVLTTAGFALGAYTVMMVTTGQASAASGWFWTRSTAGAVADTLYGTINSTIYSVRGASTSTYNLTTPPTDWGKWSNPATTAKLLVVLMDGTHVGHRLRINAAEQSLTSGLANEPGTSTTTDQFTIAARNDAALPSQINVAEIAVYRTALPAAALNVLEEYARRRYNLY